VGTAFRLYFQGMRLALGALLRGEIENGLKLLIMPVGYWRFLPHAIAWEAACALGGKLKILDVSSPKVLSLVFGQAGHDVMALDLDDPQLTTRWLKTAQLNGLPHYRTDFADARKLPFPAGQFDFVYSISVVEHIPGQGDTEALREMARVVRPGGRVFLEIPLRYKEEILTLHYDSKGFPLPEPRFYERRYDPAGVVQRLHIPELEIEQQWVMGENLAIDPWIATPRLPRVLRLALLPFEAVLAWWNLWLEPEPGRQRPLSMNLLYRKPE
jgi:SAM-dependent methyltransferase